MVQVRRVLVLVVVLGLLVVLAGCGTSLSPVVHASAASGSSASSSIVGAPTLSVTFINQVLEAGHSPAMGTGQALYDEGVRVHIDPAYALAFFLHESAFGTQGEARNSLSLGNVRCMAGSMCRDGYAWFSSWEAGFHAWYVLLSGPLYVGAGLTTIQQIIPRYAPSVDHNDEHAYSTAVLSAVAAWRAGHLLISNSCVVSVCCIEKEVFFMALVLTGIVIGMRPVGGEVEQGPRKGEAWQFLSLEISDTRFGKVYSCQLRDKDAQYSEFVDGDKLRQDLTGHKVKVTVMGQTAGERGIEDKGTKEVRTILQIRSSITNVRDLGIPDDDD